MFHAVDVYYVDSISLKEIVPSRVHDLDYVMSKKCKLLPFPRFVYSMAYSGWKLLCRIYVNDKRIPAAHIYVVDVCQQMS